jgi:lipid A 4'-phosphatase
MTMIGARIALVFGRRVVWIPLAVLAVVTLVFWTTDLDIILVRPFFSGYVYGTVAAQQFPLGQLQPWKFIYDWGTLPPLLLGITGLAVWIVGRYWSRLKHCRKAGLFLALMLAIGPGVLVNVLGKPCFGRPRPYATKVFGGPHDYVPVLHLELHVSYASFPSGHASVAFCLMAPAFICLRRRPRLATSILVLGLCYGGLVGMARIVAGGHFPSDVLWTGAIVYFTGLALAAAFKFDRPEDECCLLPMSDCRPAFEESELSAAA